MNSLPSGTVTFLFTDIEGSTKIAQGHREQWETLRARHHAILQSAMDAHNGHVFQIIGDAFCVAFHTAIDAVNASVTAQKMLHQEAWNPVPIKVRMGIHTGTAQAGIVDDQSGGYKGYTALARTQRLMSAGHGGQVLISLATEQLVGDDLPKDVALRDMGARGLKDLIRAEHIYQLVIPNLPADFPPIKTLDAYRHNLPVQLTSFVGREKEMEQIAQSISEHRLVTLTGVGGTGKTRLSLQVAAELTEEFSNGVWFVELASISDPELIPQMILSTFGIKEQQGRALLQILTDYFRERNLLLVLDNCEHLIRASAKLADTLLNSSHSLKILATSREALGVKGEATWHVPSLSLPDMDRLPIIENLTQYEAVRLFVERALLVQPTFTLTNDNASFVVQICSRLDGIPLAIELAASRVKALSVDQIAKRLDDRFRLLTGGSRTALERHQTLRATIDWSYYLLSEAEQDMLQRLSVFAGGWTLEAAEAMGAGLTATGIDWLDLLTDLLGKSLVLLNTDTSRYSMLETIRQYGREKMADRGQAESYRQLHQQYFLRLAEEAEPHLTSGAEQAKWLDDLEAEHDNLRLALDWSIGNKKREEALRLAGALGWFWNIQSHFAEGREWLRQALSMEGEASTGVQANALAWAGWMHHAQGDTSRAMEFFYEGLDLRRKIGDLEGTARSLLALGEVEGDQGNNVEARRLLEESLVISRKINYKTGISRALSSLGYAAHSEGDLSTAFELYEEGLAVSGVDSEVVKKDSLINLGNVEYARGNNLKARRLFHEALVLCRKRKDKLDVAYVLSGFANILCSEGQNMHSAQLQGFVTSSLEEIGARLVVVERADYNKTAEALKAALGEEAYQKAFEQGKALSLEQAIELALEEPK